MNALLLVKFCTGYKHEQAADKIPVRYKARRKLLKERSLHASK